jgi:orotate phosphoribosyltransferase
MTAVPKKDPAAVEAEVREKIHLEILKRTGAYHANDHVLLPSGQHTSEYIEKTLVTTEPSFTKAWVASSPSTSRPGPWTPCCRPGPGPSSCRTVSPAPSLAAGRGLWRQGRVARQAAGHPPVEFQRLIRPRHRVLLIEDLVSSGSTLNLLIELVEQLGAQVVGVGCLWRRTSVEVDGKPVFSLVSRDFPTYNPEDCPLCRKGVPLNEEFVRRASHRRMSSRFWSPTRRKVPLDRLTPRRSTRSPISGHVLLPRSTA